MHYNSLLPHRHALIQGLLLIRLLRPPIQLKPLSSLPCQGASPKDYFNFGGFIRLRVIPLCNGIIPTAAACAGMSAVLKVPVLKLLSCRRPLAILVGGFAALFFKVGVKRRLAVKAHIHGDIQHLAMIVSRVGE